jgi:hypothetical protein
LRTFFSKGPAIKIMGIDFSFFSKDIPRVTALMITLAAVLLAYIASENNLITFIIFGVLLIAFTIFKLDSRVPIVYAILLLLIAAVMTSLGHDDSVQKLALLSYWLLVVGIVAVLIDFYRKTKPV